MKDIIEMAREAGFDPHDMSADFTCNLKDIERFAELVRADEREQIIDLVAMYGGPVDLEAAIRNRSNI